MPNMFNSQRLPDYEKGSLLKHVLTCFKLLSERNWSKLKTHSEMTFVEMFEYLNATIYYFAYPTISIVLFLTICILFSMAQAGCALVALAIFTEGSYWVVKNRLDLMRPFEDSPSLTPHANQSMKKHNRKMAAIHPNLFKWALINAFLGTVIWGFG